MAGALPVRLQRALQIGLPRADGVTLTEDYVATRTTQRRSEGLLGSHSGLRDEARVRSWASQVARTHQALLGSSSSTSITMCTAYPEAGLLHDRWCLLYGYPDTHRLPGYPVSRRVVRYDG